MCFVFVSFTKSPVDFEHTDDEFTVETVGENESNVVIFSDPSAKKETTAPIDYVSKAQMKAFMVTYPIVCAQVTHSCCSFSLPKSPNSLPIHQIFP